MTLFSDFFSGATLFTVLLTLKYASLALLVSWLLSLVFIYLQKRFLFSIFRFLWVLPGFAYALITLHALRFLGVQHRYSMMSVFYAWVLAGTPFLTVSLQGATQDLDRREKEALQSLGAGPFRAFYLFEILRTLPAQALALLQQFWLYLTSFSLVMILSGGLPNETLEVAIYNSVRLDRVDFTHAFALGLWQMVILIPLRLWLTRFESKVGAAEWTHLAPRSNRGWIPAVSVLALGLVFAFARHSNLEWEGLGESVVTSLLLSFLLSFSAVAWTLVLAAFQFSILAEIGAWISPMLFTLIWWKFFGFTLSPFFNALVVQIILFSPWVVRSLMPVLSRVRVAELEAARSLGARPLRAWFAVEWPRVKGRVRFAFALVFALSMSEVTAVLLFSQNQFEPLAVWVQNAMMRFRLEEAACGTCILIVISFTALSLGQESS